MIEPRRVLEEHDVTDLIGLRVVVAKTALEVIDEGGDVSVEVPDMAILSASAVVARCLSPVRLLGGELKAIRKIAGWTATDLAAKMGEKTSHETISRWENEKQPMGGYAEKVFRLVVCEELKEVAIGVGYEGGLIAQLMLIDPWRSDADYVIPPMIFQRVKVRKNNQPLQPAWEVEETRDAA